MISEVNETDRHNEASIRVALTARIEFAQSLARNFSSSRIPPTMTSANGVIHQSRIFDLPHLLDPHSARSLRIEATLENRTTFQRDMRSAALHGD